MKCLLALAAAAVLVAGCSDTPAGQVKLEVGATTHTPEPDWETVKMDNWDEYKTSYTRVRHKCDGHGHRVYVKEDSSAPFFVVINDKTCPGGVEDK